MEALRPKALGTPVKWPRRGGGGVLLGKMWGLGRATRNGTQVAQVLPHLPLFLPAPSNPRPHPRSGPGRLSLFSHR